MRKLLKIVGAVFLVGVIAIIAVPFIVPVDTMKEPVLAKIEAMTGRRVSIGRISLSLFPDIALKAEDVHVGNPAWAGSGDMASIRELRVGVKLMPLLHRQVDITEVTLGEPVIALIKNHAQANWQFTAAQPVKSVPAATGARTGAAGAQQAAAMLPRHVTIRNGRITYTDIASGKGKAVSGINLILDAPWPLQKASLEGSADIEGHKVVALLDLSSPLTVTGDVPSDVDLALAYDNVKLTWKGTVSLADGMPSLTGKVAVPSLDASDFSDGGAKAAPPVSATTTHAQPASHWSDTPIDLTALDSANADLTVDIGTFVLPKTRLSDIPRAGHRAPGVRPGQPNDGTA